MGCSAAVVIPATNTTPAVVRVKVDDEVNYYMVCECACPTGGHRMFDVVVYHAKDRGHEKAIQRYTTLVAQPRPSSVPKGECTCPGSTYRPGQACRHIQFISVMWQNGHL